MGGSAKPPKPTDEDRRMQQTQQKLMEEQLAQAKKPLEMPELKAPKPLPPPAPPAQQASSEVAQKEEEARQKAMRRTNSARGTIFAGETGGLGGKKSILG